MKFGCLRRSGLFLWLCLVAGFAQSSFALVTRDYAIEITATTQEAPAQVTLNWRTIPDAETLQISRKQKDSSSWTLLATVPGNSTSYTDANVSLGNAYEYAIVKAPETGYARSGYIYVGLNVPLVDSRGKVLLIVEETHASYLSLELSRLQQDLVGDGWTVVRRTVSRHDTPALVRALIQAERDADSNLRSVFLFGRIPVPYSGNYEADDHPDHKGAWAADTYYGDVDGHWSDTTANTTHATRLANHNVPGDGKFDQSQIPSDIDLEVGRVDLANMPAFAPKTERDLLAQYLVKNHNFRHGRLNVARRGILFDGFGESGGEAYAASGWRNLAPFFGSNNINDVGENQFFPTVTAGSYLWTSVSSGGGKEYDNCYFIGKTVDFARNDIRSVFTMFFGSYFGDWDSSNNFLRAPLGSGNYALTAAWAGRPHWFFHHMAVGETIGYSTRLSQNNDGTYVPDQFKRQVHIALMGDPTLRMHVVEPPSNLTVQRTGGTVTLNWGPSSDPTIEGYHVYRSPSANGPFARLTDTPISGRSYTDGSAASSFVYMVRAIKLERTPSGSYYNGSQGIFVNGDSSQAGISLPETLAGQTLTLLPDGAATLSVVMSRDDLVRVYTGEGDGPVDTSSYVYTQTSSTTATVSFGETSIELSFTSGAAGTFVASGLAGNSYNGRFVLAESAADFNSDGEIDLIFFGRNRVLYTWELNGTNFVEQSALRDGSPMAPSWRSIGTADFNGDGKTDILFQHNTSGKHALWLMDGTSLIESRSLGGVKLAAPWKSVALGDFNGDGIPDILFQHVNGPVVIGFLDETGTNIVRTAKPTKAPPAGWRAFAAADFNQDRNTDILFQNKVNGKLAVWYYQNLVWIGANPLNNGKFLPAPWKARGVADLNDDGNKDVILQHTNGKVQVWHMDNATLLDSVLLRGGLPMTTSAARLFGPN